MKGIEKDFITLSPRKHDGVSFFFEIVMRDSLFCVQYIKHYISKLDISNDISISFYKCYWYSYKTVKYES